MHGRHSRNYRHLLKVSVLTAARMNLIGPAPRPIRIGGQVISTLLPGQIRAPGRFNRPYLLRSPIGYDGRNREIAKRTLILVVVLG